MAISIINYPHVYTLSKKLNLYLRMKLKTFKNQN